jgi:nucleoside-diphosphate-sugar epimerase
VIITGAAGRIGSQIVEELSQSHELHLIDRRSLHGGKSIVGDLSQSPMPNGWRRLFWSKRSYWTHAFEGADVLVHLAANGNPKASWEEILKDNIQTTWNVFEAAVKNQVPRIVFASSNWAVKAIENKLAPSCYQPSGPKINSKASPCPSQPYGLSKAFGELGGRMLVEEGKLRSFVAVRIGNYQSKPSPNEAVRARWIGVEDIRSLFRRCVEADFEGFHFVYGVSAQDTSPYDLTYTRQLLSWSPRQLPVQPNGSERRHRP